MTLMPSQTMSQQQQQQWKEPDVAGSFHNGTDSEGLVASVTPQRLREVDQGGAVVTEGGGMATEGGAMTTEGGGTATEGGGTGTEGGAMATEGGAARTEGGAMATEVGAAGIEGGAVATEGDYEGDDEGDDVFVEAPDEDYAVLFPRDDDDDGGEAVERIFEAAVDDASDVFTLPNLLDDLVRAEMSELMPSDDDYDDDDDDGGGEFPCLCVWRRPPEWLGASGAEPVLLERRFHGA
ncbi:unnamed protein product [Lampetra fluviatilis]